MPEVCFRMHLLFTFRKNAHSSLELLSDPPASASQVAGITGVCYCTRLPLLSTIIWSCFPLIYYLPFSQKHTGLIITTWY
uniref:Uncharacterized protein n=1 Tax=Chrysemys picta bellii TaxID=8478 RepID=A0A8C3IWA1_CHRPI